MTLFPPDRLCVCGCPGSEHEAVWAGDTFKGTRCKVSEHGGHKFALLAMYWPSDEPAVELLLAPVAGLLGLAHVLIFREREDR